MEVDDIIFDEPVYRANGNLETLDAALRENLLDGVRLYRRAMLACDKAIASTDHLAAVMRQAGVPETLVIENALDAETLDAAVSLRARRTARAESEDVLIVYGSGTKTHDVDFAAAAPALVRLMSERPEIHLRIVGELALPPEIDAFGARVERFEAKDYRTWLALLSEADIALAPLEDTVFNDAKSNIKFLEAAVLGIPSVSSPRANSRAAIVDGETGLLAEEWPAWFDALDRLADDAGLRRRIGEAACAPCSPGFARARRAIRWQSWSARLDRRPPAGLRVLVANIFFWPRSFGGATIVAEEMASRLNARDDAEIYVFTSHVTPVHGECRLRRYERDGMPIVSVGISAIPDEIAAFDNPLVGQHFAAALRAVRPDVVHVHSIQGIGASILAACREQGVPSRHGARRLVAVPAAVHGAWRRTLLLPDADRPQSLPGLRPWRLLSAPAARSIGRRVAGRGASSLAKRFFMRHSMPRTGSARIAWWSSPTAPVFPRGRVPADRAACSASAMLAAPRS